jgi:CRP-like cAMP-binding protein
VSTKLDGNRLLAALSPAASAAIKSHLERLDVEKGFILHEQGDAVPHVYFPHDGMVSLVAVMSNGATAESNSVGAEGVAGAASVLSRRPAMTRALVQMNGAMARLEAGRFRMLLAEQPQFREAIDRWQDAMTSQAQQFGACNLLHLVEARLARWILSCNDRVYGDDVHLTQELLGEMLGVRRTTVTEVARGLQERGLIKYRRGSITIVDRERLEATACECRQILRREIEHLWDAPLGAEPPH